MRELELANAAKTRLRCRQPTTCVSSVVSIGLLADLLRDAGLPPPKMTGCSTASAIVQALYASLKGLLDLSRIDAGAVQARSDGSCFGRCSNR